MIKGAETMTEVSWLCKGVRNGELAALASQAAQAHLGVLGGIVRVFGKISRMEKTLPRGRVVSSNRELYCN